MFLLLLFFSSGYLSTSDPHHSDTCCSISSTDLGIPSCCSTNTVPCQRKSYLQILPVVMKIHLYQQICGSFSDKVFKSVEKCPKIDNEEITKFSHIFIMCISCKAQNKIYCPYKAFVFSATGSYGIMYNSNGNLSLWH